MIRKSLLMVVVLSLGAFCWASVSVEYRVSRVHGLIDFVMTISGEPHHAPGILEIYKTSAENTPENQSLLKELEALKPSLHRGIDFGSSVPGRHAGANVLDLLITQSLFSADLKDLSVRSLGLLPKEDHVRFFTILEKFSPIYEKLIWKSTKPELLKHKKKLETLAQKVNFNEMFSKAEVFYGAKWPKNVPFVIGLYPIPYLKNFKNSTTSHSLGSIEEHGVLIGAKSSDLVGSFGVIFHELCHSLYDSQPVELMREFEKYFSENGSPYRLHAYNWVNEALATAIGNGWAYEAANNGQIEKESWYNHPIVDSFGKDIYPMTKEYLQTGRTIDRDYVQKAIEMFGKRFPDSIYTFDIILNSLVLAHDASFLKGPEPRQVLRNAFRISSYSGSAPFLNEETVKHLRDSSETAMIVFSENEMNGLSNLTGPLPFLKKQESLIRKMKNRSFLSALDEKGRAFILIKVSSRSEFEAAITKMKEMGKFNPGQLVYDF